MHYILMTPGRHGDLRFRPADCGRPPFAADSRLADGCGKIAPADGLRDRLPRGEGRVSVYGTSMKYLIWLGIVGLLWWFWRKRPEDSGQPSAPAAREAESMVVCAHCGVFLPQSDALLADGRAYCNEQHRRAAGGAPH